MRTFPVNLAAFRANVELVEMAPGERLEALQHLSFADRFQGGVAVQTALEGNYIIFQFETPHHFQDLLARLQGAHAITAVHLVAHQQPAVTREQDAILGLGNLSQFFIVIIVAVGRVKAQNPQVARQFAEVNIQQEAMAPIAGQSLALVRRKREDIDAVASF